MHSQKTQTERKNLKVSCVVDMEGKKNQVTTKIIYYWFLLIEGVNCFLCFLHSRDQHVQLWNNQDICNKVFKGFKVPDTVIWALQSKNVLKWELVIRNLWYNVRVRVFMLTWNTRPKIKTGKQKFSIKYCW